MTKKIEKLNKDKKVYSIKLSKRHPNNEMYIEGILIKGYTFKNYELPESVNLNTLEIKTWFIFEQL